METRSRIDALRKDVRTGLAARALADDVKAQLDRKVDWERMHDVVGTITEKTVGDYVRANVDRIHREVEVRIQKVFDIDPTMRADMQVRSRGVWIYVCPGCTACRWVPPNGVAPLRGTAVCEAFWRPAQAPLCTTQPLGVALCLLQ